jgi:thymidylate synthase (FAD)
MYWEIDLHNLFHFLRLRLDPHAQMEIRVYAEAMHAIGKKVCPLAFEAFERFILNAVKFTADEMAVLRDIVRRKEFGPEDKMYQKVLSKLGLQ